MRIAICDDEARGRERIQTLLEKEFEQVQTREFDSGMKLLAAVQEGYQPDILLLDIAMEGMSGMETAGRIKELSDVILIFVTGVKEQVFQAFDVGAFHYLVKPVEEERLKEVLNRAMQEVQKHQSGPKFLLIKSGGAHRRIPVEDILYVESSKRKVDIHTWKEKYTVYATMKHMEDELGQEFYRCHRGYLVNMAYVAEYGEGVIGLQNGEKVYVAREKYAE